MPEDLNQHWKIFISFKEKSVKPRQKQPIKNVWSLAKIILGQRTDEIDFEDLLKICLVIPFFPHEEWCAGGLAISLSEW